MSRVVSSARGGLLLAAVLRGGSEGTGGSRKGASRRERDQAQASPGLSSSFPSGHRGVSLAAGGGRWARSNRRGVAGFGAESFGAAVEKVQRWAAGSARGQREAAARREISCPRPASRPQRRWRAGSEFRRSRCTPCTARCTAFYTASVASSPAARQHVVHPRCGSSPGPLGRARHPSYAAGRD